MMTNNAEMSAGKFEQVAGLRPEGLPARDRSVLCMQWREPLSGTPLAKSPFNEMNATKGAVHRIENPFNKPVQIAEVQMGSILKESDIIRYKDIYGRIN